MSYDHPATPSSVMKWMGVVVATLVAVLLIVVLSIVGFGAISRSQDLKHAHNQVKISAIEIQNQEQRIQVTKQKAQIRFEEAKGIKEAQDEISKTLTPLYVQFEMVDALKAIAASGKNNSVVYIPSGANGIPLVSDVSNATSVGKPKD